MDASAVEKLRSDERAHEYNLFLDVDQCNRDMITIHLARLRHMNEKGRAMIDNERRPLGKGFREKDRARKRTELTRADHAEQRIEKDQEECSDRLARTTEALRLAQESRKPTQEIELEEERKEEIERKERGVRHRAEMQALKNAMASMEAKVGDKA